MTTVILICYDRLLFIYLSVPASSPITPGASATNQDVCTVDLSSKLRWVFAQAIQYQFNAIDTRQGLSNNQIRAIFKDESGFVWFGTMSGLNRYDGYNFKTFRHQINDLKSIDEDYINQIVQGPNRTMLVSTSRGWNIYDPRTEQFSPDILGFLGDIHLPQQRFTDVVQDRQGNFWFVFPGVGIGKFNASSGRSILYKEQGTSLKLYSNKVTALTIGDNDTVWVIYSDGVLEKIDVARSKVLFRSDALQKTLGKQQTDYKVFGDSQGDLWIYANAKIKGVCWYNAHNDKVLPISQSSGRLHLNNDIINGITQDNTGKIWIATDHGGVNIIDKASFSATYLLNNENDSKSLSENAVNTIYKDNQDIIWLGTFKRGINFFHPKNILFPLHQHQPNNPSSLPYNDINRFVEDKKGNLWIGSNGGGLIYFDRKTGRYQQYLHHPANNNSLSNNVIVNLFLDQSDKLWIGTYYGGLDCFDGKTFTHYKHDKNAPFSIPDDSVWEIFEDSQGRLWVGTLNEGLQWLDRKNNKFVSYKREGNNPINVTAILEDKQGNIWTGTSSGIDIWNSKGVYLQHIVHAEKDAKSLSHDNVNDIILDSRGWIWIATRDGLNLYNQKTKTFKVYRKEDGLPDNVILTLLEDKQHHLWLSTPNGLCNITINKAENQDPVLQYKIYDETDGLQSRQFNVDAALMTRAGELVFGGPNGFNLFMPPGTGKRMPVPKLVLTDLQVFNNSIQIGKPYKNNVILPEAISTAKEITLKYNQNVFTIAFAALEYSNAAKIKYAYQLKGFSEEWLSADSKDRKATFTNLSPGTYTLLVKAANEDGVWTPEPLKLMVRVLPPFWLTNWAYACYLLVFAGILVYARHRIIRREKGKFALEQERLEAQRIHEMDVMKIHFFTNVSHEFRTPLSLIITPIEKLIQQSAQTDEKKQFQLIQRNAKRLLNMVDQLLDFRKLEEHELRLSKSVGDLAGLSKEVFESFSDVAEYKRIKFSFQTDGEAFITWFDHDKLERVLLNLLSNAFKFTPEGGQIGLSLQTGQLNGERAVEIRVSDNGIGIEKEKQEKIFERFFQNVLPGRIINHGSGIGLSITREFVLMHEGSIRVESALNEGSSFTVLLPLIPVGEETQVEKLTAAPKQELLPGPLLTERKEDKAWIKGIKKTLLLVEDNDDLRFYIKDNLKSYYNIIEAPNGKIGWQKALAEHPDLVVSDINMPEMSGVELCQKIKEDKRTSFIPVILLTVINSQQQQIMGLKAGANDYITKPFNFEILLSKIRNLLSQQDNFKKTYQKQVKVKSSELNEVASADEIFIQKALAFVEKNISEPELSVQMMSKELLMSRAALYKKLFNLTGQSPLEFIRAVRMQRAVQLLEKGQINISEVAYAVGFNNPKYFTKSFKEVYHVTPSAYLDLKSGS
eukprot:gene11680-13639_t